MIVIGRLPESLELSRNDFVVEALASTILPEWVEKVLSTHGRTSRRKRQLPAHFVVWFVVLMGMFRRTSYDNLLAVQETVGDVDPTDDGLDTDLREDRVKPGEHFTRVTLAEAIVEQLADSGTSKGFAIRPIHTILISVQQTVGPYL